MIPVLGVSTSQDLINHTYRMEARPPVKPASGIKRETWGTKFDFFLALVGFSVGLGNVWRFPYLCYKNGGGAFLIPYLICVVIGALPLLLLEISLGQFMAQGGINAWRICPLLQGIGWATTIIIFFLNCYYEVILAWAFYYFFSSFTTQLPWDSCGNEWNTPLCNDISTRRNMVGQADSNNTDVFYNTSDGRSMLWLTSNSSSNYAGSGMWDNGTASAFNHTAAPAVIAHRIDPVTEFWENKVLGISDGIENVGEVKWDICLCLLMSWILVYCCICKGIKSFSKVVYVTAIAPYVLMSILLVRGATLPGAIDGIKFYIIPNFSKLATMEVWVDAGTQVFFSYSIGIGGLTALGSYNTWNHNSYRDSVLFALVNSGTSVFSGFVIFSVLGFMAHEAGEDVASVAESGPGLAFVAYPKAISQMPIAPLWSIVFFVMIILLGLDSQFVGVEGLVTAIQDTFPTLRKTAKRKALFVAVVVFIHFLVGLPMCTRGGMYVFQLFDYYPASRIVVLIGFLECITVAWIYGVNRYYDNMEMMFGFRIGVWMKVCWLALCPIYCLSIFLMSTVNYSVLTYKRPTLTYEYPGWAVDVGWMLAIIPILAIAITAVHKIYQAHKSGKPLKTLIEPQGLTLRQLRAQDKLLPDDQYPV